MGVTRLIDTRPAWATPSLEDALNADTVDDLKWYAAGLSDRVPTRKAELVALLRRTLSDPAEVRRLWEQLKPIQRQVVAEVVHNLGGRWDYAVIRAKYPGSAAPKDYHDYSTPFNQRQKAATPYDLLFHSYPEVGRCVPRELATVLRNVAPRPEPLQLRGRVEPPAIPDPSIYTKHGGKVPKVFVSDVERAALHDLGATLFLVQQGKVSVGATGLPTLASLRHLREHLLVGDYFADGYDRADEAIRPLALVVLVQAARWAVRAGPGGKLELTRAGEDPLAESVQPRHVREVWERWLKSDLLDELSRIKPIKGQQSRKTHLTKPAERRPKLAVALRACPVGQWVELDEFFRYLRAEKLAPNVERGDTSGLSIGSYYEYGWLESVSDSTYWDVVVGSYLRALLFEYAATLGMVELAYTRPEATPHEFGDVYGLDDYEYLSLYDGLLGFKLTALGAYVLGLAESYTPPAAPVEQGKPPLLVLPNLDVVVANATALTPTDRAMLERVGVAQSEGVYRLSRDRVLDATQHGLTGEQIRQFLAGKAGLAESRLPQTVRSFFDDLERRVGLLREAGRVLVLESDDPLLLTELAHTPSLRGMTQLATVGDRTVLLVPHDQETVARRQLKKLGYLPRKG